MSIISRGFRGRGQGGPPDRVPPGQYLTDDFPVLSAGPTPHTPLAEWTWKDVNAYATVNELPKLSLYDEGYTSIGCAPCTLKPVDPNNLRSGRWAVLGATR